VLTGDVFTAQKERRLNIFVLGSYVRAHCLGLSTLPSVGESVPAQALWIEHGGKGLNVAVALHRLGASVTLLAAIGQDASAQALRQFLQAEGISTDNLIGLSEASGFGVGFVAADGSNCIAVYSGANALLSADHIKQAEATLAAANAVYAQFEIADEPILAAFQCARQHTIRTVLNPSPWRTPSRQMLALTDVLIVNETEAVHLFELSQPVNCVADWQINLADWAQRIGWQGELLVVTLAEQGCVALQQNKVIHKPAFCITAVDATGAGDAFSAAITLALLSNPPPETLRFANACGAYVAARQGVLSILPTAQALVLFIELTESPSRDYIPVECT
jgi:ribokinase